MVKWMLLSAVMMILGERLMWKMTHIIKDKYKPKVLICDQESYTRASLKEYLSSIGFFVEQAKNSNECIDVVCFKHPDVILIDLEQPEVDGFNTMSIIREMGINIPVLLFSSRDSSMPFDKDTAIIKKPYKHKELGIVLETLILATKKERCFLPRRFKIH